MSRNPSRSRPLSDNVKRLMAQARESPENPNVIKIQRPLTARDYIYCDMQGNIFMAAIDHPRGASPTPRPPPRSRTGNPAPG